MFTRLCEFKYHLAQLTPAYLQHGLSLGDAEVLPFGQNLAPQGFSFLDRREEHAQPVGGFT